MTCAPCILISPKFCCWMLISYSNPTLILWGPKQWVEIVSEATEIHNRLKSVLKAQFTIAWNCFWSYPNSQWVDIISWGLKFTMGWNLLVRLKIHSGMKSFLKAQFTMVWNHFWSNPNSQWVEILSEGSIHDCLKSEGSLHNGLKLFLKQPKFTMGSNIFWRLNLQWVQ